MVENEAVMTFEMPPRFAGGAVCGPVIGQCWHGAVLPNHVSGLDNGTF